MDEAATALRSILEDLGVRAGDCLYLGVDMGKVPLPAIPAALNREAIRAREREWCRFVFTMLMDAVGPKGTIVVPTFSYGYARHGTPYVHEETPSEIGPFTEFVRQLPESRRSLHPLNSVSAHGARARDICDDVGRAGYGVRSAFGRLREMGTRFVCLGTTIARSLTYIHHLEHLYGVNHMFHKIYTAPVSRGGVEVPGPWLCYVRYLGIGVEARIANLEARLAAEGALTERAWGAHPNQAVALDDVERVGFAMLDENPWAILAEPVEVEVASADAAPLEPRPGRRVARLAVVAEATP